jgi:hypothetical protein
MATPHTGVTISPLAETLLCGLIEITSRLTYRAEEEKTSQQAVFIVEQ